MNLLFPPPPRCLLCDRGKPRLAFGICLDCREEVYAWREKYSPCPTCGRLLPHGDRCQECFTHPPYFLRAAAVGPYTGVLRASLLRFKFYRQPNLAKPLGYLMAGRLVDLNPEKEVLVPVPLTDRGFRERGYNQSLLLARVISGFLRLPVVDETLVKVKETPPQVELGKNERLANLAGAFQVTDAKEIMGKSVILVDDILTTGATAQACSGALLAAGAAQVKVITAATSWQIAPKNDIKR